jgi:hypothetical protein
MNMPGFSAEMSLNRDRGPYISPSVSGANSSAGNVVVLARVGPVSDCACCIFSDKYKCCRDCVEAILS